MRAWVDAWLGPCVREIPAASGEPSQRIYLTFDDGPHPQCTEKVLRVLEHHRARATFFLVAERAHCRASLTRSILKEGHGLGNHSLDHRYRNFFTDRDTMRDWIRRAQDLLSQVTGLAPVGFRSPAGVRTPPLHWSLRQLEIPLVHWTTRFFDTQRVWSPRDALRSLVRTSSGTIVLLHDTHVGKRQSCFLEALNRYLEEGRQRGFHFDAITRADITRAYSLQRRDEK